MIHSTFFSPQQSAYKVFHTGGLYSREIDAIGGYMQNLIQGVRGIGQSQGEVLHYISDPHQAEQDVKARFDDYFFTTGKTPVLHIQLVHPDACHQFSANFIRQFSYPVVVTCQELTRQGKRKGEAYERQVKKEIIDVLRAADKVIYIDDNERKLAIDLEKQFYPTEPQTIEFKSHFIGTVPGGVCPKPQTNLTNEVPDLVHFGIFRPGKGHEYLADLALEFMCDATLAPERKFYVIGAVTCRDQMEILYDTMLSKTHPGLYTRESILGQPIDTIKAVLASRKNDKVIYLLNLPSDEITAIMARSQAAVFLFPDGSTKYGSSIPAAMAHGLVPIVTLGKDTPNEFSDERAAILCRGDDRSAWGKQAYALYKQITDGSVESSNRRAAIRGEALRYASVRSPKTAAGPHAHVYELALNSLQKRQAQAISSSSSNDSSCERIGHVLS